MRFVQALELLPGWKIPSTDLVARFVRSSGPGGQNVNKVATKVELRFGVARSGALSPSQKERLAERFPSAMTLAGEFVIACDETRSQANNLEAARERLKEMILSVRAPPRARRATRPTRGAKQRRLTAKKQRSDVKRQRGRVDY